MAPLRPLEPNIAPENRGSQCETVGTGDVISYPVTSDTRVHPEEWTVTVSLFEWTWPGN